MDDFIRRYGVTIYAFLVQLVLTVAFALTDALARSRIEAQLRANPQFIRFSYSPVQRILMAIGAIMFGAFTILSATLPERIDTWIPILFFVSTIICAVAWYSLTETVIVDEEGVTMTRLWTRKRRIDFRDLIEVRNHKIGNYIVLRSPRTKIQVGYHLQGFQIFLAAIEAGYYRATGMLLPIR